MKFRQFALRTAMVFTCGILPAYAHAQSLPPPPTGPVVEDPAETAKIKWGPLFMQPSFSFKNVGKDNNVFNEPDNPQTDWTGTISMGTLIGLRFGAARFTVKTMSDYVYFAHFREERSIDGNTRYQFEIRTPRLRPWIAMDRIKTHDRAGLEIDSRAGRELPSYEAGVEYRPGFRLGTRLMARSRKVDYESQETVRGDSLEAALDARYEDLTLQLLYEISPLSAFRLGGEVSRSTFEQATIRDAVGWAAFVGIEGKKDAGIEGYIDVGWRKHTPDDPTAPSFVGVVARASASMILWDQVLVAFAADRDIPHSYETDYTFYVQEGGAVTVTWRPHSRFEIFTTGRHYWLNYDEGVTADAVLRTDTVYSYGGGFGFFLRGYPGTKLGITVERAVRESILPDRRYNTPRIFSTVGFSF